MTPSRQTTNRTNRKHSGAFLARRIIAEIWHHPNNKGRRSRALARSVLWQIKKRLKASEKPGTVFGTMRIWMNPRYGVISNIEYFGDYFDPDGMTFLERYLRPGDVFVDAGANIGAYTILAAKLIGTGGSVHAFEPAQELAEEFRRNVKLNRIEDIAHLEQVALSDHAGWVGFRSDRDVSNAIAVSGDPQDTVERVRCGRLDDLLPEVDIAAIKLDVEGSEVAALHGFARHLQQGNPPVILLEVFYNQLERQGASLPELLDLVGEAGYRLATFDGSPEVLRPAGSSDLHGNYLAVRADRWDEVLQRLG